MTERADPHAADTMVGPPGQPTDHGGDHRSDHGHDDHATGAGDALGPLDSRAWVAAALGIALGLAVVVAFLASTGFGIGGS